MGRAAETDHPQESQTTIGCWDHVSSTAFHHLLLTAGTAAMATLDSIAEGQVPSDAEAAKRFMSKLMNTSVTWIWMMVFAGFSSPHQL